MMRKDELKETSATDVQALYQPPPDSHKGENGKLLLVVGSEKYHGSAVLTAKIASRCVDLVYFCSVAENNELLRQVKLGLAEFITVERDEVASYLGKVDAVLLGPGLGVGEAARELCQRFLKVAPSREGATFTKIILDADALKLISPGQLGPHALVTPHAGEFEILFGKRVPAALEERVKLVRAMAAQYRCNIVLKGPVDVIAGPSPADPSGVWPAQRVGGSQGFSALEPFPNLVNDRVVNSGMRGTAFEVVIKVNRTGNAGMTKGGTGDILAGLIAALACKNDLLLAGCAGAYLNGLAGDRLAKRVGWVYNASDLAEEIPRAYGEVKSQFSTWEVEDSLTNY